MPLRYVADRYRLLRRVGVGGMGTVWEAEDERLGRQVAVKLLHVSDETDADVRFLREAQVGATLSHPSIVTVYDVLELDEGIALIMEYVEGQNLRERLRAGGRLPPKEAIAMLRPVAAALDAAHAQGVVHRDVKPANILLGKDGRARLADLGIAFLREGTRLTRPGVVMGTAPYMPPEQLERGAGSPAGDVYALGAVAFEALSGKKARRGRTPMEVALEARNGGPPDLAAAWAGATPAAAEVLKRAMAPETEDRPGSTSEFVNDLAKALGVPAADTLSAVRGFGAVPPRDHGPSAPTIAPVAESAARRTPSAPARDTSLRTRRPEPPPRSEARRPEPPLRKEPPRSPRSPTRGLPSGSPAPRAARPSNPHRRPALLAAAALAVALIATLVAIATLSGSGGSKPRRCRSRAERGHRHARDGAQEEPIVASRLKSGAVRPGRVARGSGPLVLRARRPRRVRRRVAPRRSSHAGGVRQQRRALPLRPGIPKVDHVPEAVGDQPKRQPGDLAGPDRRAPHGPHRPLHRHPRGCPQGQRLAGRTGRPPVLQHSVTA